MDGNRKRAWAKVFPKVDLTRECLTESEVIDICKALEPNLNLTSDIIAIIKTFDRRFPAPNKYHTWIKQQITNKQGKVGGSKRTLEYWLVRGWDLEESKRKVSEIQKLNSPRTEEYWISRGLSRDDAKVEVSKFQANSAEKMHLVIKENNSTVCSWNKKFWIERGFSENESKEIVRKIQKGNNSRKDPLRFRLDSPFCLEYWLSRGFDEKKYTEFMNKCQCKNYSKKSFELFSKIQKEYPSHKMYFGETEFGKFIPNVGYRKFDFIDLTKKLCIEFHGTFWHRLDESKENDRIKKEYIESLGFSYLEVLEENYSDYEVLSSIKELYENCS